LPPSASLFCCSALQTRSAGSMSSLSQSLKCYLTTFRFATHTHTYPPPPFWHAEHDDTTCRQVYDFYLLNTSTDEELIGFVLSVIWIGQQSLNLTMSLLLTLEVPISALFISCLALLAVFIVQSFFICRLFATSHWSTTNKKRPLPDPDQSVYAEPSVTSQGFQQQQQTAAEPPLAAGDSSTDF